jgi:hypothetical protein
LTAEETHPQSDIVLNGGRAVFHGGVEGQPSVRYQWHVDGLPIYGETNETLILDNVTVWDEGAYTVAITDATGVTESNPAYLYVVAAPLIVTDPASRVALAGSSTIFTVVAIGENPFGYQWRHDGSPIPNANGPSYTIASVQPVHQGGYDVIVENDFGSVTSRVAQLTVNQPPVAVSDVVYRSAGQNVAVEISDLLANDGDPDGETITFVSVTSNSVHGASVQITGRYVSYTAPAGFNNADSFSYTISDPRGGLASGLVSVQILSGTMPRIDSIQAQSGTRVALNIYIPANRGGAVDYSPVLSPATWTALTNFPAAPGSQALQVTVPAAGTNGFYRVRSP